MAEFNSDTGRLLSTETNRHEWISVAAYYKAEARGFKPGKALDDWLEAEIEYAKFQIQAFLVRCEEDGAMSNLDLQGLAFTLGIKDPEAIESKVDLIREIQKVSDHRPCFQSEDRALCPESECQWRSECLKLIAEWIR